MAEQTAFSYTSYFIFPYPWGRIQVWHKGREGGATKKTQQRENYPEINIHTDQYCGKKPNIIQLLSVASWNKIRKRRKAHDFFNIFIFKCYKILFHFNGINCHFPSMYKQNHSYDLKDMLLADSDRVSYCKAVNDRHYQDCFAL